MMTHSPHGHIHLFENMSLIVGYSCERERGNKKECLLEIKSVEMFNNYDEQLVYFPGDKLRILCYRMLSVTN